MHKQKIAITLFSISIFLLLINLVISKFSKSNGITHPGITVVKLNSDFENVITGFDIPQEYIKKIKVSKNISDSIKFIYDIGVPADLPITVVLNELNRKFSGLHITLSSTESIMNRNTILKISYFKEILLQAFLETNANLIRNKPSFGFLVNNIDELDLEEFKSLMIFPEKYSVMLVPSEKSENLQKQITDNGKEFVVVLSENISEMNFKLKEDYNPRRLKLTIRNILVAFYNAKLYMFDRGNPPENNNALFQFVKLEFDKRKLKLVPLDEFIYLQENDEEDINTKFRNICMQEINNKIFIIDAEDFLNLRSELELLRKKGYKFLTPSALNFGV